MITAKWIDGTDYTRVGDIGFLVERSNPYQRLRRFELQDSPPHTNQSNEPRLYGWCGSWNDLSTYGHGLHRVEKVARNGRAYVRHVSILELDMELEKLGYPQLGTK